MDGLIVWIKKNQLLAAVIALIIVSAGYSQFLAGPRNYEDCILMVVKDAKSAGAAGLGRTACEAKFPKEQLARKPRYRKMTESEKANMLPYDGL